MPQYRRLYQPGGYYFFTVVTHERREFLTDELARKCLRYAWLNVRRKHPFRLISLCLLPEHLHCIWRLPEDDADFSRRWAAIKAIFSQEYYKLGGKGGTLSSSRLSKKEKAIWQRRFWEHLIRDDDDLGKHIDYIHYNPIKHGLVEVLRDWPWSTFHKYVKDGYYNGLNNIKPSDDFICVGE